MRLYQNCTYFLHKQCLEVGVLPMQHSPEWVDEKDTVRATFWSKRAIRQMWAMNSNVNDLVCEMGCVNNSDAFVNHNDEDDDDYVGDE